MFTGIITDVGTIATLEQAGDLRVRITTGYDTSGIDIGASIASDGVCLTVVDLGSGSGGVMPLALEKLRNDEHSKVELILTDLHPSTEGVAKYNSNFEGVSYHKAAVDATKLKAAPSGIKTMVNAFHHMSPLIAKNILQSAQDSQEPILIFEMQENKIPTLIWALFLPLGLFITFVLALVLTPFSRPLTFSQLVFTYLIPIIPLGFAWDGQMSYARMYSMKDYDELLPTQTDSYKWEKGYGKKADGKKIGTYLLGLPQ